MPLNNHYDVILVGAGLANGLIALRLRQQHPSLQCLLLESSPQADSNHTWSFHQGDLHAGQHRWIAPLVSARWSGYQVRFPALQRHLPGDYFSISSAHFARQLIAALGDDLRTGCAVHHLTPTSVTLADGRQLHARAVIDGRGVRYSPYVRLGYQVFVGQEWQLAKPHGLTQPLLMDATVPQQQGYRFVYTLPLSADRVLIEDTHYIDTPLLDDSETRKHIADYAQQQGWRLSLLMREERGALPITLSGDIDAFWQQQRGQPCSGLRAGLFHATTGYSLPTALRLAELIVAMLPCDASTLSQHIEAFARRHWREQRFFRLLNRMLFLAARPEQRWRVMQRFYQLDADLIARFYAGQLTLTDKARILCGKPPVPPGAALRALLTTHTGKQP
ncbi:lycopene beta-cyclase CrtY [Pantoea phytobeneficialis]|uniref:Lycopene beta-cyclase CrtY n=1 Tax=Pantoea phytobeneficialis TaxID=2052056 RepID=A0AAP9KRD2_9GAMM|nr:lycopene beta-cyclase CrtY [Pantoea phytobeneficialis]MDO6409433.1 lycopene beta-cyclase CrtY [Pantoea phytobeneficialis]QGR08920.1 lycopene cyclase [Pantoea phytobeneficialis]